MITVQHLVKEYKTPVQKTGRFAAIRNLVHGEYQIKRAVDDISFEVEKGEIVGYIGKNGAGKSTTIKMLSGILQPTSGSVLVGGVNPAKDRMVNSRQIGAVFGQKTQLWWDVPLIESYRLLKEIYQIDQAVFDRNLSDYVAMMGLEEVLKKPVRQMSLGQRVKSDIVASLLHDPPILFLDEPTIGVDIVSKKYLHDFILQVNKDKQTTILLTTHDISDMEKLCSRVIMIDDGKIMYSGTISDMTQRYGKRRSLLVEFEEDVADFEVPGAVLEMSESNRKRYSFDRTQAKPSELIQYISSQHPITDLQVIEPEVESIVRAMYDRK